MSTYEHLLDDLDRRHKNFHFQTILSWSHNVYDKPPTDVIWRFFAHWDFSVNQSVQESMPIQHRPVVSLAEALNSNSSIVQ